MARAYLLNAESGSVGLFNLVLGALMVAAAGLLNPALFRQYGRWLNAFWGGIMVFGIVAMVNFLGNRYPERFDLTRGPPAQPRRSDGGDAQGVGQGCPRPRLYGGGEKRRTRTAAGRVGDVQHSLQLRIHRPRPRSAPHRGLRHPPLRHAGVGKRRQTTANHRTRRARDRQLAAQADARAPKTGST